jgi:hypothetical protein
MRNRSYAFALILAAVSKPAFADMTANYVGPNNVFTMKIEIAANGDIRGTTSNPNSYFITRGGHGYMVQASFNGPTVMRMEDISVVMTEQMKRIMPNMPSSIEDRPPSFDLNKGGIVTVRGRQGIAYYLGNAKTHSANEQPVIVISNDAKLAPLGVAMQRQFAMSAEAMSGVFGKSNPFAQLQGALKDGAPLVFTGMELDTVNTDPIPAAEFALPASPLSIEDVRKNLGAPAMAKP